jgi:hypothetical protein
LCEGLVTPALKKLGLSSLKKFKRRTAGYILLDHSRNEEF